MNTVVHDLSDFLTEWTNSEKEQIEESISSATTQDEILDVLSETILTSMSTNFVDILSNAESSWKKGKTMVSFLNPCKRQQNSFWHIPKSVIRGSELLLTDM